MISRVKVPSTISLIGIWSPLAILDTAQLLDVLNAHQYPVGPLPRHLSSPEGRSDALAQERRNQEIESHFTIGFWL